MGILSPIKKYINGSPMRAILRFFVFHDWLWSVLFLFMAYWLTNWGPPTVFGIPMTYYAINWVQALMASAGVLAGLLFIARMGLWFYFRKVHDYIYGFKNKPNHKAPADVQEKQLAFKKYHNQSFEDFKAINPKWIKICIVFFVFFFLLSIATLLFLKFLSAAGVPTS